jgi:hypothetical protein
VDDVFSSLTNGNVTPVKVVLASVALALAVYQLALIAVGYGKVRPPFLGARPASLAHRTSGDVIAVLLIFVSLACVGVYGWDEDGRDHAVYGAILMGVLATKVLVVRFGLGLGRALPLFGLVVFVLLALTWGVSAGDYLGNGGEH